MQEREKFRRMTITEVKTNGGAGVENAELRRVVTDKLDKKGSGGPWLWYVDCYLLLY